MMLYIVGRAAEIGKDMADDVSRVVRQDMGLLHGRCSPTSSSPIPVSWSLMSTYHISAGSNINESILIWRVSNKFMWL